MEQVSKEELQAVVQIIDICSRRGAFEGAELEGVGALRSRLVSILEPQQEESTPPEAE